MLWKLLLSWRSLNLWCISSLHLMIILKEFVHGVIFLWLVKKHVSDLPFIFNFPIVPLKLIMLFFYWSNVWLQLLIFFDDLHMDILHKLMAPGCLKNFKNVLMWFSCDFLLLFGLLRRVLQFDLKLILNAPATHVAQISRDISAECG